jgi:hypothetical protein
MLILLHSKKSVIEPITNKKSEEYNDKMCSTYSLIQFLPHEVGGTLDFYSPGAR